MKGPTIINLWEELPMNQVSWLIYLSGILPNLAGCLIFVGIVIITISITYFCVSMYIVETKCYRLIDYDTGKEALKEAKKMRRWCPTLMVIAFTMWIVAAFCPSQETILAIAASEFGEQLLHTKTANLAEQALDSWLQRQIHPGTSPSDPK